MTLVRVYFSDGLGSVRMQARADVPAAAAWHRRVAAREAEAEAYRATIAAADVICATCVGGVGDDIPVGVTLLPVGVRGR